MPVACISEHALVNTGSVAQEGCQGQDGSFSTMMSLHMEMHSSQMHTPGPATRALTCFWVFSQNEHLSGGGSASNTLFIVLAGFLLVN